ncbi:hypothetical protein KJ068_06840 [bacterium]|nr:hypothetical protein [bacterium]
MKEMGQQKKQAPSKAKAAPTRSSVVSTQQSVAREGIAHPALMLQQAVGNHATQKLLRSQASPADGKLNQARTQNQQEAQSQVGKQPEASPEKAGETKSPQQQKADEKATNAISYEFDLVSIPIKGTRIKPFILGAQISGKIAVSGEIETSSEAAQKLEVSFNKEKVSLEIQNKLTEKVAWRTGGELNLEGGKFSTGPTLELGIGTFTLNTDAVIFEKNGKEITFMAVEIGLSGTLPNLRIPLPGGVTANVKAEVELSASIEPNWLEIGILRWRFVGKAAEMAVRFGAAAAPYIAPVAAFAGIFIWTGYALLNASEAHQRGKKASLPLWFASDYSDTLDDLMTMEKPSLEPDLLNLDITDQFNQALEIANDNFEEARVLARKAAEAAAAQYIESFIKTRGLPAWTNCRRNHFPRKYRQTLERQANDKQPIGIKIDL